MDNIRLNDEQWAVLKQAQPHFESVKKEYIRNAPRWLTEQIINVFETATGAIINNKNLNCSVCVLNIYKRISRLYDYNKKIREGDKQHAESKCEIENGEQLTNDGIKKKRSSGIAQKRVVKKKNNGLS
jgi:hypothetical protein